MSTLDGRIALITGAARGIGLAIAQGLSDAGAHVILTDIDGDVVAEELRKLVAKGRKSWSYGLDVGNIDACAAFAETIAKDAGAISILVNNAGIMLPGKITDDKAPGEWVRTIAVNVSGPFHMCRAFHRQLLATKGAVINLASIRSFVAPPNAAAYTMSKGAIMQFTKALAAEWGADGIRVNAIAPGFVETTLVPDSEKTPAREAAIMARTPVKRIGDPEDVAGAAVFLASDAARFITGAILPVDGGYLAA